MFSQTENFYMAVVYIYLFSGMDILGYYVTGIDMSTVAQSDHLEWWTKFQFSSITTQLFWVFNQCIPAWLVTILLFLQKSNKYMAVLLAAAMLNCTLPFVGLIPFAAYWVFSENMRLAQKMENVGERYFYPGEYFGRRYYRDYFFPFSHEAWKWE